MITNTISCILQKDALVIIANAFHVFTWACLTCTYFIWRYKIDFGRMRKLRLSKTALFVVFLGICGVISLFVIQQRTNRWIYSTSNLEKDVTFDKHGKVFIPAPSIVANEPSNPIAKKLFGKANDIATTPKAEVQETSEFNDENVEEEEEAEVEVEGEQTEENKKKKGDDSSKKTTKTTIEAADAEPLVVKQFVDYGRVFHLLFGAPLIEEVVLRIALTTVIQRRLGTVISSIVWTNVIFSSLHIVNALHNASSSYTLFQVFAGFILGTFYSTRLYITGNLYESLTLHILNNMAAIWIPISITWTDTFPHFSVPLLVTQLVFILLLIKDLLYIREAHRNYESVAPMVASGEDQQTTTSTAVSAEAPQQQQPTPQATRSKTNKKKTSKHESKKQK